MLVSLSGCIAVVVTLLSGVSLIAAAVVLSWPGFVLGLYQGQEQGHCSMRFNLFVVFLHPLQQQLLVFLHPEIEKRRKSQIL